MIIAIQFSDQNLRFVGNFCVLIMHKYQTKKLCDKIESKKGHYRQLAIACYRFSIQLFCTSTLFILDFASVHFLLYL